jgi:Uncharacterized protein conserved in bacteria
MGGNESFPLHFCVVLLAYTAQGQQSSPNPQVQKGSWIFVQNLEAGTLITVKKTRGVELCHFARASEDDLECRTVGDPYLLRRAKNVTIPRNDIREVRLPPNQTRHGWAGAGIGAGVGAGLGSRNKASRGGGAFVGALGGALIGGLAGMIVPIFKRGKLIYKAQPRDPKAAPPAPPSPEEPSQRERAGHEVPPSPE